MRFTSTLLYLPHSITLQQSTSYYALQQISVVGIPWIHVRSGHDKMCLDTSIALEMVCFAVYELILAALTYSNRLFYLFIFFTFSSNFVQSGCHGRGMKMKGVVPELDRRVNVCEVGMVKLCELRFVLQIFQE